MTKKEFALRQIAPYYKDPSICGYTSEGCLYRTSEGKSCVFGKNLLEDRYDRSFEGRYASTLLEEFGEDILIPESRGILTPGEWDKLQGIHDSIALKRDVHQFIHTQGDMLFTHQELLDYVGN